MPATKIDTRRKTLEPEFEWTGNSPTGQCAVGELPVPTRGAHHLTVPVVDQAAPNNQIDELGWGAVELTGGRLALEPVMEGCPTAGRGGRPSRSGGPIPSRFV